MGPFFQSRGHKEALENLAGAWRASGYKVICNTAHLPFEVLLCHRLSLEWFIKKGNSKHFRRHFVCGWATTLKFSNTQPCLSATSNVLLSVAIFLFRESNADVWQLCAFENKWQ